MFRGSLQDIRLFIAAYEERSFTAAARRQNSSQSGVSHHIRHIEELLKVPLFTRQRSGVAGTPAADVFYRECVKAVRAIDQVAASLSTFAQGYQGQFRVAIQAALANRLVAPTLLKFNNLHPNVRVAIVESVEDRMGHLIKSGEADLAIASAYDSDPAIMSRQIIAAPECLVRRKAQGVPTASAGNRVNLALPLLKEHRKAAIMDSLKSLGVEVGTIIEVKSALAILDLLRRSEWATIAPSLVFDPSGSDQYTLQPLIAPELNFKVILMQPAATTLPPFAEEFVRMLTEEAEANLRGWQPIFKASKR